MRRVVTIAVLLTALSFLGGCGPSARDRLEGEKLFIPLLGFKRAYLQLELADQTKSGGVLIKYLDFAGKRVALEVVPLPSHKNKWGEVLGHGSEKNGKRYYGLKIERFGEPDAPLKYTFNRVAGPEKMPRGLFD